MRQQPWWSDRLRGAFMSYWVYQHLGNLGPDELNEDPTVAAVLGQPGDRADVLRKLATGDHDHLLIGPSLPWLLPPTFSDLESINEAACRRPGWRGRFGEWIRQAADFEHWAAFRASFDRLTRLISRVAQGRDAPATISVLSGDVHHACIARARFPQPVDASVHQLTCSPVHNVEPWFVRMLFRAGWWAVPAALTRRWARAAGLEPVPVDWSRTVGPEFSNAVMTLSLSGRHAEVVLERSTSDGLVEQAKVDLTQP
jgi:hypothetical protein